MPIIAGSVTARIWRVVDKLPPNFTEMIERNLQRRAFKPINVERGELQSMGWVNIRQMLDSKLTLKKVLFGNLIALGLRVDKLAINQKLFRAELAQEIAKTLREQEAGAQLSKEQRAVLEDTVRQNLIKRTQPSTAVYDCVWQIDTGRLIFSSTGDRLNMAFADLFSESFQVGIEPQYPFMRAQRWAERQGVASELLELLPSPFSPEAVRTLVEVKVEDEGDGE